MFRFVFNSVIDPLGNSVSTKMIEMWLYARSKLNHRWGGKKSNESATCVHVEHVNSLLWIIIFVLGHYHLLTKRFI